MDRKVSGRTVLQVMNLSKNKRWLKKKSEETVLQIVMSYWRCSLRLRNCLLRYWRRSIVILLKLHPQSGIYATKRISYFIFNYWIKSLLIHYLETIWFSYSRIKAITSTAGTDWIYISDNSTEFSSHIQIFVLLWFSQHIFLVSEQM